MAEISTLPDDVLGLGRRLIPRPVFLLGCARSGTSIFGEALASHPAVTYLFELSPTWNSIVEEGADHRLEEAAADPELARRVYEEFSGHLRGEPGEVLLEKNPKHVLRLPFLAALFPWGRFVHIIRDGRDTAASLMFRNRGDGWGHLQVPGWRELLERYPQENHIRCAHQWRIAVETARSDGARLGDRYLELRYESLVESPLAIAEEALAFMGLDAPAAVADFCLKIQDETEGSYHALKQVRHYVDNHSRRIGRYRENLTPDQVAEVEEACGTTLSGLGYLA
ncbi:MAG: sulfotransferase [Planctomycetota bacterium]|nr:sulfotransferase [Planctomycetota bacterium]